MQYIKDNIYYLNLQEIKQLCKKYDISHNVYYRYEGIVHKSNIMLRKAKIIKNIILHIHNKKISKYIIPEINACFDDIKLELNNNIYFGQFKWTDMKKIFPEDFKPVLCHLMLYDLWKKNNTITYKKFIKFYKKNEKKYDSIEHPEWKYIEDNKNSKIKNWKVLRTKIAKKVIKEIKNIFL
jgi:hypothetical protein